MLILSRREAESVCLGDNIVLTIVTVGKDKVRVGVKAPEGVRILRTELDPTTLPFNPPPAVAAAVGSVDCQQPKLPLLDTAPLKAILIQTNANKSDASKRAA